jgi:hypothetical protein
MTVNGEAAPRDEPQAEAPCTGTCASARMRKIAAWLFLLPVFSEGVFPGVVKVETAGLLTLAFASIVIRQDAFPFRAFRRVYAVFAVLSLIVLGYLAFSSRPADGAASAYLSRELMFIVTYALVAVFAVVFFSLREFEDVLWRIASIALPVGIATCAASRLTGHLILVNPDAGGLRMVGTLSEPSGWAPILSVILLLAFRRRSLLHVLLSLAGLFLTDSPTCILVMIVSACLYALAACRWRGRAATIILLSVTAPFAVLAVSDADVPALTASGDPAVVAVGRLVSGIRNAETDGQVGQNSRYASVLDVTEAAREGGWTMSGAGPAADAVYFAAVHAEGGPEVAANAMWLSVLFDLGEWGLAVFAVMLLVGLRGMRRNPAALAVFLPFFTASMVNSAIPDYSVTALGILLFAFGWLRRPSAPGAPRYWKKVIASTQPEGSSPYAASPSS